MIIKICYLQRGSKHAYWPQKADKKLFTEGKAPDRDKWMKCEVLELMTTKCK